MTKYNHEVRIKVVEEIEKGESIKGTARKYGIARNIVRGWYRRYQQGGIEGLIETNHRYSADFKLAAVEYLLTHDVSLDQAATTFGIPTLGTLWVWRNRFLAEGGAGLQDTQKGRPPKMPKETNKPSKSLSKKEQYEARIKELEMENAYLKKLNALVTEREKSEKKTK
jgi:transposase